MDRRPPLTFFSDANRFGGAEGYLEILLRGLGPTAGSLVHFDGSEDMEAWGARLRKAGFIVDSLSGRGLSARSAALLRWATASSPSAVHVNLPGPYDGLFAIAPAVLRAARVRTVVVTEHLPSVGRVGKRYWLKRLGVGSITAAIALCRKHQVLLSETFGYAPSRCHVVANGVNAPTEIQLNSSFPEDLRTRETWPGLPRIVQVGSLERRKGVWVALEAAELMNRSGIRFNMWLVGEGPLRGEVESVITARELGDVVRLSGQRADIHAIWQGADIALLASFREGMPLSLIEAMAHSVPCVATTVDGIPDLIESGREGRLVRPDDAAALAEALSLLVADERTRLGMGRAAREKYVRQHTAAHMIERTRAVYQGIGLSV